jgi:hypothetical protein
MINFTTSAMTRRGWSIEAIIPGQGEQVIMNASLRALLVEIQGLGRPICKGLEEVLEDEPD